MREGKSFQELSYPVVPRTQADAERIKKRGEKTKEVLFQDLKVSIHQARLDFAADKYLADIEEYLRSKTYKYFNPKSELVKLVTEVEGYIENLTFENESAVVSSAGGGGSEDEDDVDTVVDVIC